MVRTQPACGIGRRCALEIEITGTDRERANTGWCSGRSSRPCSVVTNGVVLPRKQRERIVVEVEVQEIEFVGALPDLLQHQHVQRVRIADRAVEPQRPRPRRFELRRCARIAAGKQRHVVTERDQFLGQPVTRRVRCRRTVSAGSLPSAARLEQCALKYSCYECCKPPSQPRFKARTSRKSRQTTSFRAMRRNFASRNFELTSNFAEVWRSPSPRLLVNWSDARNTVDTHSERRREIKIGMR